MVKRRRPNATQFKVFLTEEGIANSSKFLKDIASLNTLGQAEGRTPYTKEAMHGSDGLLGAWEKKRLAGYVLECDPRVAHSIREKLDVLKKDPHYVHSYRQRNIVHR